MGATATNFCNFVDTHRKIVLQYKIKKKDKKFYHYWKFPNYPQPIVDFVSDFVPTCGGFSQQMFSSAPKCLEQVFSMETCQNCDEERVQSGKYAKFDNIIPIEVAFVIICSQLFLSKNLMKCSTCQYQP